MNTKKLENLKPQGVALLTPFIKELVCDTERKYGPVDGYQAAIICMNLTMYLQVRARKKAEQTLTDEESSFFKSFKVILKDQQLLIKEAHDKFSTFVKSKIIDDEQSEHFKHALFHDTEQFRTN